MEEMNSGRSALRRRLFWLCALALVWELVARPLLGILMPELELPQSAMHDLLAILARLPDLPF